MGIANNSTLFDMDDLPDADVVIYDGQCNFCRAQVERLNSIAGGRLAFVSLHDSRVAERFPDLSHNALMQQMYVVTRTSDGYGRRFGGADAGRYLSRRLPWLWIIAPFLHLPFSRPLWQFLYRQIALRRYLFAGKSDCESGTCQIK